MKRLRIYLEVISAILLGFAIVFLTGCYTEKQAIKKFCKPDTIQVQVHVIDTITIPAIEHDTIIQVEKLINHKVDTIIIHSGSITTKLFRTKKGIQASTTQPTQKIFINKYYRIKTAVNCPQPTIHEALSVVWDYFKWFIYALLGLAILYKIKKYIR